VDLTREDFLKDKKKLRMIRKILLNLVSERVSIRDLVTIMETIGDHEDQLEKTDLITEMVRTSLARQICWAYLDMDGVLRGLVLSREMEEKVQGNIKETKMGLKLMLDLEQVDLLIKDLKKTLEDYKNPRVIFCEPQTRIYFRRLIETAFPDLAILSTTEIARGIPVEILGQVELPGKGVYRKASTQEISSEEKSEKEKKPGLFGLIKT
jgi:flagellar biosynthesis protein FlhA